jgi:lysyl-tRNA synthetase class 2
VDAFYHRISYTISMNWEYLEKRAAVLKAIRNFFHELGYLELDTPILTPELIPESHIELFKTEFIDPYGKKQPLYLLPSPEYYLKRCISEGCGNIFQIAKSFRNSEQIGKIHNPEFTLLEYYTIHATAEDSLALTQDLFTYLYEQFSSWCAPLFSQPITVMTMSQAFQKFCDVDLENCLSLEKMNQSLIKLNLERVESWEDGFHKILVHEIEPRLEGISALTRWPAQIATLAASDGDWSERWELYVRGMELCNCYTEERDAGKIQKFFDTESRLKEDALVRADYDEDFAGICATMPPCSGNALGIDRLIASMLGLKDIQGVILFPLSDILTDHSGSN